MDGTMVRTTTEDEVVLSAASMATINKAVQKIIPGVVGDVLVMMARVVLGDIQQTILEGLYSCIPSFSDLINLWNRWRWRKHSQEGTGRGDEQTVGGVFDSIASFALTLAGQEVSKLITAFVVGWAAKNVWQGSTRALTRKEINQVHTAAMQLSHTHANAYDVSNASLMPLTVYLPLDPPGQPNTQARARGQAQPQILPAIHFNNNVNNTNCAAHPQNDTWVPSELGKDAQVKIEHLPPANDAHIVSTQQDPAPQNRRNSKPGREFVSGYYRHRNHAVHASRDLDSTNRRPRQTTPIIEATGEHENSEMVWVNGYWRAAKKSFRR